MIETVILIIITIPLAFLGVAIVVMIFTNIFEPDVLSRIKNYLHKKRLAGRTSTQKFQDLGYEKYNCSNGYVKIIKVPISKTHIADGETHYTEVEVEKIEKEIKFNSNKTIVLERGSGGSPFLMTLEEMDAISTKIIELGWLEDKAY